MKWKAKPIVRNTEWHKVFAWRPVKTEDGFMVLFEMVSRRYKVNMHSGFYVYHTDPK